MTRPFIISTEGINPKEKMFIIPEPLSALIFCIILAIRHRSSQAISLFFISFSVLVSFFRDKAPGQRECDSSIDNINKCIRDIEQASLAVVSQNLPSRDDISLEVSSMSSQHIQLSLVVWETSDVSVVYRYLIFLFFCKLISIYQLSLFHLLKSNKLNVISSWWFFFKRN